mgnify:FL=1
MNIERIFKNLILADFLAFIFLFAAFAFEPEEISKISDNLGTGVLGSIGSDWIFFTILGGFVLIYYINLILLYRFVYFAKTLFLILVVLGILLNLVSGPTVSGALAFTLELLDGGIQGAILVFLYFTPIKDKFLK